MMASELRLRIFRLLEERTKQRTDPPTAGEIAEILEEPLRSVVVTLRSSQAMGMVEFVGGFRTKDEDLPVMLKPQAYIYIESQLNE